MRIPIDIREKKYICVTVQPKNECKLEFSDQFWLPFLDQPQSETVVFKMFRSNPLQGWY